MPPSLPSFRSGKKKPREEHEPARADLGAESLEQLKSAVSRFFTQMAAAGSEVGTLIQALRAAALPPTDGRAEPAKALNVLDLLLSLANTLGVNTSYAKILRGATDTFSRKGVDEASIEDILETAQVSRRTFYQFFRNKTDVLQALFEMGMTIWLEMIRTALSQRTDPTEKLRRVVQAYVGAFAVAGFLIRVMVTEALKPNSPIFPRYAWVRDEIATLLLPALEETTGRKFTTDHVRGRITGALAIALDRQLSSESTPDELRAAEEVMFDILGVG